MSATDNEILGTLPKLYCTNELFGIVWNLRVAGLRLGTRDRDRLWGPESGQVFRNHVLHIRGQGHGLGKGGQLVLCLLIAFFVCFF